MVKDLVLTDMHEAILRQLQGRAMDHGRTPEEEAKAILSDVLGGRAQDPWARVDEVYQRLVESGRTFSDSVDLLREDRER